MTDPDLEPSLVPEFLVSDVAASLDFWVRLCGFVVRYDRPEERFAYLTSGSAHVMLEQIGVGRNWIPAPLERPLGRGINFQIAVASVDPLLERLSAAGWPLFLEPEVKRYRVGASDVTLHQFVVQDPDGYLLRFSARASGRE